MSKYLDELDDEICDLERVIKDAQTSIDNLREDFDDLDYKLDSIKNVIKSNQTAEDKLSDIEAIIAR